jgi:ornithine--oxo-acid transaminase
MEAFKKGSKTIKEVRGRGLLNAIQINDSPENSTAWEICVALMENGLLAKPTHGNTIRFTPPLVMTETQMKECIELITSTLKSFEYKIG